MTAISNAVRSTQLWEDTALGPKNAEYAPPAVKPERHLHPVTPELVEQVEIETNLLNHWVAFRVAPTIVGKIYAGESLDVDTEVIKAEIIVPELVEQQLHYLEESIHIVNTQIPDAQARLEETKGYLSDAEDVVADATAALQQQKETGYGNLYKITNLPDFRRTEARHRSAARRLENALPGLTLKAQVWDEMFIGLNGVIKGGSNGELAERTDEIIDLARKSALEQVIISLNSEIAMLALDGVTTGDEVNERRRKIALLEAELEAYSEHGAIEPVEAQDAAPTEAVEADTHKAVSLPRPLQLLGSFGSRAFAVFAK